MSLHNPDCDGSDYTCKGPKEVRILPVYLSRSNLIVCRACFDHEMSFRRQRILDGAEFKVPEWDDLKAYSPA